MKHVRLLIVCALMLLFSGQGASAEQQETVDRCLEKLAGTWYDGEGNAVLTIADGTINGCAVVGGDRLAGGYREGGLDFFIKEATETRTLRIGWMLSGGACEHITLAGGEALQRTLPPPYFESVSGIHFGMRTRTVREILGEGQALSVEKPYIIGYMTFAKGWYYPDKGLIVLQKHGIVTGLVLLRESPLRFDSSGLGATDGREAYARAYGLSEVPEESSREKGSAAYSIAPDENLLFGQGGGYVMLSVYDT